MDLSASVVVTTKNRKDDLQIALASVVEQTVPVEIVVIDDGSDDGTPEMVRSEFPTAMLYSYHESRGYVVRRNEAARLARGSIVLSIDDDAAFSSRYVVEQTLQNFDHPSIGAVAIPFINVNQDNVLRQRSPDANRIYIMGSYIGTAHALRRDLFLALGGYRDHLVHQGEEGDYCVRMLATGYVVRIGTADPIHHFESPRRSYGRMDYYGRRNDILFSWHNSPSWRLPDQMTRSTISGLAFGLKVHRPFQMMYGLLGGYADCLRYRVHRRPVPHHIYALYRWLRKQGPVPLDAVLSRLPKSGCLQ